MENLLAKELERLAAVWEKCEFHIRPIESDKTLRLCEVDELNEMLDESFA